MNNSRCAFSLYTDLHSFHFPFAILLFKSKGMNYGWAGD